MYETAIQDRLMIPKIGVTPISELLHFLADQHLDGLAQLFLEKARVKTHAGEHGFGIVQHVSKN